MSFQNTTSRIFVGVYVIALLGMTYLYWQGAENYIDWKITAYADKEDYTALSFEKGPFELSIPGSFYTISESFSAGPVERHFLLDGFLLLLTWLGLCMILALSTYLSRVWFTGIGALFIFLLIRLELTEVTLFGFAYSEKVWSNVILIVLFLAPAYLFHAYLKNTPYLLRLGSLALSSLIVVLFGVDEVALLRDQLTVGLHYSMIVVMLLFLLVVAEENVFGILYLITKNRGAEGNQKHFPIFSLFYLGFLGLAYAKKAGMIRMDLPFFDPYVLLAISCLVSLWSLAHKKDIYSNVLDSRQAQIFLSAMGLSVFGFLALAFSRGNDPVFEGYHYFILYAHLGFGAFFFFYIIANFVNPLSEGLQIYKVVYKEQNFPYVTGRIGGLIAVVAFFLMADQEAFKLFKAGYYNYAGDQQEYLGERDLAERYYTEASIYGFDNHYSNYKIGYYNLQKNKIREANYKFGRATLRYPTPESYVNQASTFGLMSQVNSSIASLQEGIKRFPGSAPIYNNLGLIYTDLGDVDKAGYYFAEAGETGGWSQSNLTNLWKIGKGRDVVTDYKEGNAGVKANVLASLLRQEKKQPGIRFDSALVAFPMHKAAYLMNSVAYFRHGESIVELESFLGAPLDEEIYSVAKNALAVGKYQFGYVNEALHQLDEMGYYAKDEDKALCLNMMGLICLNEHAVELAKDYFQQALVLDSGVAELNLAITAFEQRQFEEGLQLLSQLNQPQLQPLIAQLKHVFAVDRGMLNEEEAALHAYYLYEQYSLPELSLILQNRSEKYVLALWNKILREQGQAMNYDALSGYVSLFQSMIPERNTYEAIALISLHEGQKYEGKSALAQLILSEDTVKTNGLYQLASKNALNAGFVLAVNKYLQDVDQQKAYDLLVHALDVNPNDVGLMKAYVLAALDVNLIDYATPVLDRLSVQLSTSDYSAFLDQYQKRLADHETTSW